MAARETVPMAHRAAANLAVARHPGIGSAFELALRFTDWARQMQGPPTVSQIIERWGVDRSTAYRWLSAYNAARGKG